MTNPDPAPFPDPDVDAGASDDPGRSFVMRLYVTGTTAHSTRAVVNLRRLCEEHLPGRYDLQVIDISSEPDLAGDAQIIAAPTLVKSLPLPLRRFIGDMSHTDRLLVGLGLRPPAPGRPDRPDNRRAG